MATIFVRAATTAAILALTLAGCTSHTSKEVTITNQKPPEKRNVAPDFTLKDADGKTVKLSDYKGKVVLLNFLATWCGPCKIEIPWFIEFQKTYKDKGFTVIGVSVDDEGWEIVKPYLASKQVNYPVVVADEAVNTMYGGIESLPTTFVIDKDGKIANTHIGLVSKKEYESDIEQLLR
jgi:cytochrome c biogenesis protein CcmG/thiol:disulfide interchange protein DsbE